MQPYLEDLDLGPYHSAAVPPGGYRCEPARRRVRTLIGETLVADSMDAMLLLESGRLPVYYFPWGDVRQDLLEPSPLTSYSPLKGEATYWHLRTGDRHIENAVWRYTDPPAGAPDLAGHAALYWNKMDAWYEEDERVFAHARDPYKRVDVLPSSRHLQVVLGGETVVDSHRPRLLIETGLLTRYYVPEEDVRMDLLERTETHGYCPYKGQASYWTATIGEHVYPDIVWSYLTPLPECLHVAGLLCFYNEHVDAVILDGEELPVPVTPWSRGGPNGPETSGH